MKPGMQKLHGFWRQISAGLTLQELWFQFRREARGSMAVYSSDGGSGKTGFKLVKALFRAMFEKLSPARRVLLLVAIVMLFVPAQAPDQSGQTVVQFPMAFFSAAAVVLLLALELADRVAMKRDLEIARDIQKMLLPDAPPQIDGIDIAFATRPANTVAGDYYDAFVRTVAPDRQRLFVLVADVAGKGIPAGMLMATLQANVRAFADEPVSLVGMVSRLNRCTCARSGGGRRFTTAFFAEMDLETRSLTYVNAGHNPPVLARANGSTEHLHEGGLPLGVIMSAAYESGAITLGTGDTLYIYTDGVVEAVSGSGEEYGETRFESLVRQQANLTASEKIASLLSSISFFTGTAPQYDDITCLVLRVAAAGQAREARESIAAGVA